MSKVDFKKTLKHLYQPKAKEFVVVEVPRMNFLMIDGKGSPVEAGEYGQAVAALYGVAYKLKFMSKQMAGRDYVVPPLEGLWWAEDLTAFVRNDRDNWLWTMMIMTPDWITAEMYAQACEAVEKAKQPPALSKMRMAAFEEGLSVQIMHIGPYADEAPTIARLHQVFLPENGLVENGHHHEIYLGDPRKTAPERLKTVLRQPVAKLMDG